MTTMAIRRGTPLRYALAERERSYDDRGDKMRHAVAVPLAERERSAQEVAVVRVWQSNDI